VSCFWNSKFLIRKFPQTSTGKKTFTAVITGAYPEGLSWSPLQKNYLRIYA
jgi:hypothetical protein